MTIRNIKFTHNTILTENICLWDKSMYLIYPISYPIYSMYSIYRFFQKYEHQTMSLSFTENSNKNPQKRCTSSDLLKLINLN